MTTLLLERPPARDETHDEGFECGARRRLDGGLLAGRTDAHGRLTLEELIAGVWEGLAVRAAVTCPVCEGPMAASPHENGGTPAGACLSCGSRLS